MRSIGFKNFKNYGLISFGQILVRCKRPLPPHLGRIARTSPFQHTPAPISLFILTSHAPSVGIHGSPRSPTLSFFHSTRSRFLLTMSALQFLNKKSWHTRTIHNNEKVWLKEQEAAKEQRRIEELQKKLAEERKIAEIQRLELESGRLDPAEALKRRRLNWMYEHGPANTPEEKKKQEEKERDDVLMGRKDAPLQNSDKDVNERLVLVDMEAKLREDPMFEVELRRARVMKRDDTLLLEKKRERYTQEELEAKRIRKEERRRIREERRTRREKRDLRKKQSLSDRHHLSVKGAVDDCDLLDDDEHMPREMRHDERILREYGLHIPAGGSGVAVTTEFIPRRRETGKGGDVNTGRSAIPPSPTRSKSPEGSHSEGVGRPPLSPKLRAKAEEKRKLLREMKEDALNLETERRRRAEKHVKDANREMEVMNDRLRRRKSRLSVREEEPMVKFARQTIARRTSAAERIQRKRGWAPTDVNACY